MIWYHGGVKKPNLSFERKLWKEKVKYVIGIDEVGRGAFAGPIVAGAVVFPLTKKITKKLKFLKEINDSKLLKSSVRTRLSKLIKKHALFWEIDEIAVEIINKHGISFANKMVIKNVALKISSKLKNNEFFILCDGLRVKGLKRHTAIIDGDCKSISIAAASIIAKVHRDSLMRKYSKKYHYYKFSKNKGYGTKDHQNALKRYGLSDIHRTSFELTKFLSQ